MATPSEQSYTKDQPIEIESSNGTTNEIPPKRNKYAKAAKESTSDKRNEEQGQMRKKGRKAQKTTKQQN